MGMAELPCVRRPSDVLAAVWEQSIAWGVADQEAARDRSDQLS
jgi:hypothetical protein